MNVSLPIPRRRFPAFSLPEVAIATAIAAVSLVTIVGLLPQGLKSILVSSQTSTEARIVRSLVGQLQLIDWGSYQQKSYTGLQNIIGQQSYYYDSDGNQLTNGNAMNDLSYVAQVVFPNQINPNNQSTHPMLPGAQNPTNNSMVIVVQVAPTNNPKFVFPAWPSNLYTVHTAILTRQFYSPQ